MQELKKYQRLNRTNQARVIREAVEGKTFEYIFTGQLVRGFASVCYALAIMNQGIKQGQEMIDKI